MSARGMWRRVMVDVTQGEKRANVLMVEDEPMISDIAAEALGELGFQVDAVTSASEALLRLRTGSPVDILFTDVNLPGGMDGATLARRARELRPDLPVVYTSGLQSVIGHLEPVDGAMFIAKPYDPFNVGRMLQYLVMAKRTRAGAFA
jgi:CheY-like chemotaxis protein